LKRSREEEPLERIIGAAMKVFARYGYFRAPVHLIAMEAGVSKGLVFWYFRSKEALIVEVAKRALPTDVLTSCIERDLNGVDLLRCIGVSYMDKYSDEDSRLLLINTLVLANMNEYVREEMSKTCFTLLDKVAERVYGSLNEENIAKIKIFFGGLLCYTLNPQKIPGEKYLETLINTIYPETRPSHAEASQ